MTLRVRITIAVALCIVGCYLTQDLSDTTIDPVEEARKKHEAFVAGLTNGAFPVRGPSNAPVTLTLFSDFQCPYCANVATMLKNDILPMEGKSVRLVFRHFPLQRHTWARTAARFAACGQHQSNESFWSLHDFLFEHQQELTPQNIEKKLTDYTKGLKNLDQVKLRACLGDGKVDTLIDRDVEFGSQNGVNGTPTLYLNGQRISDARNPEHILTLIREQRSGLSPVRTALGR